MGLCIPCADLSWGIITRDCPQGRSVCPHFILCLVLAATKHPEPPASSPLLRPLPCVSGITAVIFMGRAALQKERLYLSFRSLQRKVYVEGIFQVQEETCAQQCRASLSC